MAALPGMAEREDSEPYSKEALAHVCDENQMFLGEDKTQRSENKVPAQVG